jgi:hypothetical protein
MQRRRQSLMNPAHGARCQASIRPEVVVTGQSRTLGSSGESCHDPNESRLTTASEPDVAGDSAAPARGIRTCSAAGPVAVMRDKY